MKKVFLLTILLSLTFIGKAQNFLSLDSCRALALANNKDLLISNEKINAAHYERKAAFTNYLPNFSATGTYMRNQKEFSLLNKVQIGRKENFFLSSGENGNDLSHDLKERCVAIEEIYNIFIKRRTRRRFTCPRSSRKFISRCPPYRYKKCICRCHHADTAIIHGRQNPCI